MDEVKKKAIADAANVMTREKLRIQVLREEYETIANVLDGCLMLGSEYTTEEGVEAAHQALEGIIRSLLAMEVDIPEGADMKEIAHNWCLDAQYVTGRLSEEEMEEREAWHWQRVCDGEEMVPLSYPGDKTSN